MEIVKRPSRVRGLALAAALTAVVAFTVSCGKDDAPSTGPAGKAPPPPAAGAPAGGGAPSAAGAAPSAPGAPGLPDGFRSKDPAVAGPVVFAELARFGAEGDVLAFLRLLSAAKAAEARAKVARDLEGFRADPARAKAIQERMGLSKSPAEMDVDEFLRATSATLRKSGASATISADRIGTTYVSAAAEGPGPDGAPRLVVRATTNDTAGVPVTRETIFVWDDGRWAFDIEATQDRAMRLEQRIPIPDTSPNAFAFAGDAIVVAGKGLTRAPLAAGPAPAAPGLPGWFGRLVVTGTHVLAQGDAGWQHSTLPDFAPSKVTLPDTANSVDVIPGQAVALAASPIAVWRIDLETGAFTKPLTFEESAPGPSLARALPGNRVLLRLGQEDVLEARDLDGGARAWVVPLGTRSERDEVHVHVGGDVLAVATGEEVQLYGATDGRFLRKIAGDRRVEALAVSPDGALVAVDTVTTTIYRTSDGVAVRELSVSSGSVSPPLAWMPTGHRLAAWLRIGTTREQEQSFVGIYGFD